MEYTYSVRQGEAPPRPDCVACVGPMTPLFIVVTKHPDNKTGAMCSRCVARALDAPVLLRPIELAITMGYSVPQVADFFIRHGVFEIPTTHEDVSLAIGRRPGFARGIWSDR